MKKVPSPAQDWLASHTNYVSDDCLIWPFHISRDGYGRAHEPLSGKLSTASRLMCELAHGPSPSAKHEAAHKCGKGNQACVNPGHLYWATPTQNQADRVAHGTSNRGSQQGRSKLTEANVREIRLLLDCMANRDIAAKFNVHESVISHIKAGRSWAWLTD